jgi:hypothetical protein
MTQQDHRITMVLAMKEADRQGRPEVALRILRGEVRAYARTPRSKHGVQVGDWDNPFPRGTKAIVIVDTFDGKPSFFILPARAYKRLARPRPNRGPRPVNPDSRHCYITPDQVKRYVNKWEHAL